MSTLKNIQKTLGGINKMITRNDADEILSYIAQNLISPLAFDERPAKDVWLELSGEKFNELCAFIYRMTKKRG